MSLAIACRELLLVHLSGVERAIVFDVQIHLSDEYFVSETEIDVVWYLTWCYREQIDPHVSWVSQPDWDSMPIITDYPTVWRECIPRMKKLDLRARAALRRFIERRGRLLLSGYHDLLHENMQNARRG